MTTIGTNFLRSLLLAIIFSFVAPIFLVGCILAMLTLMNYIPVLQALTDLILAQILHFLATFGSGNSWLGILVISLTCTFVGALFDTYVYYRYQMLRLNS